MAGAYVTTRAVQAKTSRETRRRCICDRHESKISRGESARGVRCREEVSHRRPVPGATDFLGDRFFLTTFMLAEKA